MHLVVIIIKQKNTLVSKSSTLDLSKSSTSYIQTFCNAKSPSYNLVYYKKTLTMQQILIKVTIPIKNLKIL